MAKRVQADIDKEMYLFKKGLAAGREVERTLILGLIADSFCDKKGPHDMDLCRHLHEVETVLTRKIERQEYGQ